MDIYTYLKICRLLLRLLFEKFQCCLITWSATYTATWRLTALEKSIRKYDATVRITCTTYSFNVGDAVIGEHQSVSWYEPQSFGETGELMSTRWIRWYSILIGDRRIRGYAVLSETVNQSQWNCLLTQYYCTLQCVAELTDARVQRTDFSNPYWGPVYFQSYEVSRWTYSKYAVVYYLFPKDICCHNTLGETARDFEPRSPAPAQLKTTSYITFDLAAAYLYIRILYLLNVMKMKKYKNFAILLQVGVWRVLEINTSIPVTWWFVN